LTVFHNRRWDSDFLEVRRLIDSGELGEVWRFESRFERWRPEAPEGAWRFSIPREQGGGVLLDLGTHLVDQALQLFGPAATVYGEVHARRGGPADDDAFIAIEHDSGVLSHLYASEVAASPGPRIRVQGSKRGFVAEAVDTQEAELRDGRALTGEWPEFYRRFEAALSGRGELPVDPRDAVAVLEVLERAAAASS
jgi:predicted dehydrogenase